MSAETATAVVEEVVQPKKGEGLFGKKNRKLLVDPLDDQNPITVQVLGICSALAVTTKMKESFIMAICVIFVCAFANLIISVLRNGIPSRIRMIVQLVVIATLVTLVSEFLKAFAFDVSKQLSVYVGLIITNCIVMGRLEAFAMANKPWPALMDGIGNGVGYGAILLFVAFFRELFGGGTVFGFTVIPPVLQEWGYLHNGMMLTPAAAMFLIGIFIWWQRSRNTSLVDIS